MLIRGKYQLRCPECGSSNTVKDWSIGYLICENCNHSFLYKDAERYKEVDTLTGKKWEKV